MDKIEFEFSMDGKWSTVVLCKPIGAGGVYHIMMNHYYLGSFIYENNTWSVSGQGCNSIPVEVIRELVKLIIENEMLTNT